jgi:hypothetical protein
MRSQSDDDDAVVEKLSGMMGCSCGCGGMGSFIATIGYLAETID